MPAEFSARPTCQLLELFQKSGLFKPGKIFALESHQELVYSAQLARYLLLSTW